MTEVQTSAAPVRTPPSGPQPSRRKSGKKVVKRIIAVIVAAAVLFGVLFGMWFLVFRKTDEQGEIYFEYAFIGSIQSTVQGSGNANAKETSTITVPANGTVQELLVSAGDTVMAGQPLFSIYSETAQNKLDQAQERVNSLNEKLSNLTLRAPFSGKLIDVTAFNPGDTVGEGTVVGTLVNDKKLRLSLYFSYAYDGQIQVGQAAEISVPAVMYTTSLGVVEKINRVSYISPEGGSYFEVVLSFDNPGTLTAGMNASAVLHTPEGAPMYPYDSGKTDYYETRTLTTKAGGPLIESSLLNYANVSAGQTLLTMSSESLDEDIAAAWETLAAAQADMDALNAAAPIDGTVISCTLTEGGEVKAGDAVITISNTTTMVVSITVDDRNIGFIKLGDVITLSDYNGNSYMGTVTNINTQGEIGQGMSTFPVTLEVENWGGTLYAGAWLDYSFVTSQSEDCVLVPTTAVKSVLDTEGNKQTVVFVYREERPDNVVELDPSITNVPTEEDHYYPVPVETGISDTKNVEIKSGVQDGEQVFINYTVTSGSGSYGMYG
ncbi:MAG: efflux RND transporter periplasmic adaptor subunit [Oscillospiraceae bacterium]